MPAISVVVPVYNAASYLAASLPRLLEQTFSDVEIVVVDDGSTDATAEIAESFAVGRSSVIVVRQPANAGPALARERGVAESSGEFIWFVDADDDWHDNALQLMHDAAITTGADVIVAGARFVYAEGSAARQLPAPRSGPVSGADSFRMLLTGTVTGHLWNKLFRRTLVQQITYLPARVHSDLAMVADALSRAGTVAFIPDVVYDYRLRSGSIITSKSSRAQSLELVGGQVQLAAERLGGDLPESDEYRYFRNRYILLSSIKDGVLGPYSATESARIVSSLRRKLSVSELAVFARRRDAKRLLLGVAARTSLPAYRALLAIADR